MLLGLQGAVPSRKVLEFFWLGGGPTASPWVLAYVLVQSKVGQAVRVIDESGCLRSYAAITARAYRRNN